MEDVYKSTEGEIEKSVFSLYISLDVCLTSFYSSYSTCAVKNEIMQNNEVIYKLDWNIFWEII